MRKLWTKIPNIEREGLIKKGSEILYSKAGEPALEYLINKRKISKNILRKFNIGYFPEYLTKNGKEIKLEVNGRIITPIYSNDGSRPVAISTRHLDENHSFRFWHENYDKKYYMFGFSNAKNNIIKKNKCIVVEGEMDVLCLNSYGFKYTVCISGSAMSNYQISTILRYCDEVFFCFDPDTAGERAKNKCKQIYEEYGLEYYGIKFYYVKIPNKLDPDKFVIKNGRDDFIDLLKFSMEIEE